MTPSAVDPWVRLPLLPLEASWYVLNLQAPSCITFYQGQAALVLPVIKQRLTQVLSANPWLCGRLEKTSRSAPLQLLYPRQVDAAAAAAEMLVYQSGGLAFNEQQPYPVLYRQVAHCLVSTGAVSIKQQEALVRLTLVPVESEAADKFALIFSMSHVIADGYTFYTLYNSLFSSAEPPVLEPARVLQASPRLLRVTGKKEFNYAASGRFLFNAIRSLLFGKTGCVLLHYVDMDQISQIKQAAAQAGAADAFVSTNDILTSGFIRAIAARLCLCAMNLRDKVAGVGRQHAGNYQGSLLLDAKSGQTPQSIRRILNDGPPYQPTQLPLPGWWEGLWIRLGLVTNWSTFSGDINLPDCRQILHLPLCQTQSRCPVDFAVIFAARPGQIAMLVSAKKMDPARLRTLCLFGDSILPPVE